jgi:hypothetical protein
MPSKRYRLESTGIPAGVHGAHQRALGEVARDVGSIEEQIGALDASQIAYTPTTSGDWVAPAPTTVQDALDRLAAAGGVTPVP